MLNTKLILTGLCLFLFSLQLKAQIRVMVPDYVASYGVGTVSKAWLLDLENKIHKKEIIAFHDAALISPLKADKISEYFTDSPWIQWYDEEGNARDTMISITLSSDVWEAFRFEIGYIVLKITETKMLYIPNKEKKKLDPTQTRILENIQSQSHLEWLYLKNHENDYYACYDAVQSRIYAAIMEGKVPIYRFYEKIEPMTLDQFDTIYDQTMTIHDDDMDNPIREVKYEFEPSQIAATCILGQVKAIKNSWTYESEYVGIGYRPLAGGIELPIQEMCWIKVGDIQKVLNEDDWFILQIIWNYAIHQKLRQNLNHDSFLD